MSDPVGPYRVVIARRRREISCVSHAQIVRYRRIFVSRPRAERRRGYGRALVSNIRNVQNARRERSDPECSTRLVRLRDKQRYRYYVLASRVSDEVGRLRGPNRNNRCCFCRCHEFIMITDRRNS